MSPGLSCKEYNNRPDLIATNSNNDLLFSNRIYKAQPDMYSVSITSDLLGYVCPGTAVTFTAIPNAPNYVNPTFQWIVNNRDIPGAVLPTFTTSEIKNGDVLSVRFHSEENKCTPITANNPMTMQLRIQVENRVERIDGPKNPEVGKPATYQAIPVDNSIEWMYQWTIFYIDNQEEIAGETGATLLMPSVKATIKDITVEQIALERNCVNEKSSSTSLSTIPLPIDLLYLKAKKEAQEVILEWATAMELNNSGFEVQVSSDAVNFDSLSFIPSKKSTSYTQQVYTFFDQENGKQGLLYYRLKQIDLDAFYKYFGPVAVEMDDVTQNVLIYPNPLSKEVNLKINVPSSGKMQLTIINTIGSKIMEQTLEVNEGTNLKVLSLDPNIPPGIYTLITKMNGRTSHIKLLKH
jgi:hypothetical protein